MRTVSGLLVLLALVSPAAASGQSFELFGSAGPTVSDPGNSVAAGAGFSPNSRMTIALSVERTHLSSRTEHYPNGFSVFRGGTLYLGSAELKVAPFRHDRLGPYGLVGIAAGVSQPNVNDRFTNRITNRVGAMFFGGGMQVPIGERLTAFADARMIVGAEGNDGMVAVAPLRAGLAWRF